MLDIRLFRSKPFALGNIAGLMASVGRGGLQFMLIVWLQGIWLPLRGHSFESTPLWSGIYMLPMTLGFLLAGPLSGTLSDRFGSRPFAIGGLVLMAMTFVALTLIPVDFDYRVFAVLIFLNGLGGGIFSSRPPTPRRSCPACLPPSAAPPRVSVRRSPTPARRYRSAFSSR
jgi:MFS family permease